MKQIFLVIIPLAWSIISFGQSVEKTDSLKIIKAIEKVFANFSNPDYQKFIEISTTEIYCIYCNEKLNSDVEPYMVERKKFFDKYLQKISNSEIWIRIKKLDGLLLLKASNKLSEITALITIWKENEIAKGHEGGQIGLYFKKIDDEFKFAGFETIP